MKNREELIDEELLKEDLTPEELSDQEAEVQRADKRTKLREIGIVDYPTQVCKTCSVEKPVYNFNVRRTNRNGKSIHCKKCTKKTYELKKRLNAAFKKPAASPKEPNIDLVNQKRIENWLERFSFDNCLKMNPRPSLYDIMLERIVKGIELGAINEKRLKKAIKQSKVTSEKRRDLESAENALI